MCKQNTIRLSRKLLQAMFVQIPNKHCNTCRFILKRRATTENLFITVLMFHRHDQGQVYRMVRNTGKLRHTEKSSPAVLGRGKRQKDTSPQAKGANLKGSMKALLRILMCALAVARYPFQKPVNAFIMSNVVVLQISLSKRSSNNNSLLSSCQSSQTCMMHLP